MNISKIEIDNGFCYPEYPIIDDEDLIISLRYSTPEAREDLCIYSEIRSINLYDKSINWKYRLLEEKNEVKTELVIIDNYLIVSTKNYIIALDIQEGTVIWKCNIELSDPSMSIIDNILYLTEQNQLILIDPKNGKKIKNRKYRVQWLCQSVVEYNNRLFVSTSNYKIIEIDRFTLDIINEFKYIGKWSVHVFPLFFNNRMYANSYTSNAICFDLETNEPVWKIKKKAGSEPKHLLIPENELYCIVEDFNNAKVTACSLVNGKKKWAKEYPVVHCIKNLNEGNIIGLLKNDENQYYVGIVNKNNGNVTQSLFLSNYHFDNRFQYRLWKGADIIIRENYTIVTYSPNEIFIIERISAQQNDLNSHSTTP